MNTQSFLRINGYQIINLAHVVAAKFSPAQEGGEVYFDEDDGVDRVRQALPATLKLTLTSTSLESSHTYDGEVIGTAATSDTVALSGESAEWAWSYLARHADVTHDLTMVLG